MMTVAISELTDRLYLTATFSGSVFAADEVRGALTAVAESPAAVLAGTHPFFHSMA